MEKLKSVVGINLIIMVMYTLLFTASQGLGDGSLISCWIMGLQGLICLIISIICFVTGNTQNGKSFLLSTGLVWLIGLSTCGLALNTMTLNFH